MSGTTKNKTTELEGRTVDHSFVTMSLVIMPVHTGPGGIFAHGGEIIKLMDTAAGITALRHAHSQVVTLRVEGINFLSPIRVGNFVSADARLTYVSQHSMEVQVKVKTEDVLKEKNWEAITAYFIFVALGDDGKPREIPPLILSTDEERRLFQAGENRHNTCRIDEHYKRLCGID